VYARPAPVNPLGGSLVESLKDAQDLAEASFRGFLANRSQLTDELKQEIILTAFEPGKTSEAPFGLTLPSRSVMRQIERNENVVEQSLSQIGVSNERIANTVKPFLCTPKKSLSVSPHLKRSARG
jgi:hypothetical protein